MKKNLQLALIFLFALALAVAGFWAKYALNSQRFPDSPWWQRFL